MIPTSESYATLYLDYAYDGSNNLMVVNYTPAGGQPQTIVSNKKKILWFLVWGFTVTENTSAQSQAQYINSVNSDTWQTNLAPRTCLLMGVTGTGGFSTAPSVVISGDGTGATATASLKSDGSINSINVTAGGTGYTTATATVGSGAVLSVTVASGSVSSITVTKNVTYTNTYTIGYRYETWDKYETFRNVDGSIPTGIASSMVTDGSTFAGNGWSRFKPYSQISFTSTFTSIT